MNSVETLPVKRQCELLELPRASFYSHSVKPVLPKVDPPLEEALFDIHAAYLFYVYRKVMHELRRYGIFASEWKVRSLAWTIIILFCAR